MNPQTISASEAKSHLSEFLQQVRKGQVYRISKRGRTIAELRPLRETGRRPQFGSDKGRIVIKDDFDKPLSEMEPYSK